MAGTLVAGVIGLYCGGIDVIGFFTACGAGISSMCELIIVTMLAGGLLEIVRINGGIDFLIRIVTLRIRSRRVAEASICLLTSLSNLCTANNTIAILTVGTISRDISQKFGIAPRRAASLLDTALISARLQSAGFPQEIALRRAAAYGFGTCISVSVGDYS